jgi:hypothetical protein
LALVEGEFNRSCRAYVERRLTPLLETDVVGYAYHAILTRLDGDPRNLSIGVRQWGHEFSVAAPPPSLSALAG